MHTICAPDTDINLPPVVMHRGQSYLVEDVNAGEILAACTCKLRAVHWPHDVRRPVYQTGAINGPHSALFVMPGGFGDLVLLTAVIAAWFEDHPYSRVAVSCFERGAPVFDGLFAGHAFEVLPYPTPVTALPNWANLIIMENCVQEAAGQHSVDAMAERAGIVVRQKAALYKVSPVEKVWASTVLPDGPKRVAVQVRASALCRSYPSDLLIYTLRLLLADGWQIVLLGAKGDVEVEPQPDVFNAAAQGYTFRESVALMAKCDVVLAPDSALCHVAGALSLPTVALYGPFPWQERTLYHPSIYAITGQAPCAPCHHHVRANIQWPLDKPEAECRKNGGYCAALGSISPQRIVAKLNSQARLKHS